MKLFFITSVLIFLNSSCWCHETWEFDIYGEALHGYYIKADIGTPPQDVTLLLDTGSSNLAIAAAPPWEGSEQYFRYKESKTFLKSGDVIDLRYVQGQWSGILGSDYINLNLKKNKSVRCSVACMTDIKNVLDINSKFYGIIGLAYAAISKPNSSILPFFDTIRVATNISDVFSINLCGPFFTNFNTITTCGKFHLGYISPASFKGDIIYTPIFKEGLYEVTLTNLKVGSKLISTDCQDLNKPRTVIDTGTTRLHLSKPLYSKTISQIKKRIDKKLWLNETFACIPEKLFDISLFPPIILSFYHSDNSSFDLMISPELYLLHWNENRVQNMCFLLGIEVSDYGTIIGSTILKGYYVVFDRDNKKIGFGNSTVEGNTHNLSSLVTTPVFTSSRNFSHCKYDEKSDLADSDIKIGTIILLLMSLALTFFLLYMIIAWIRAHFTDQSDNHSDTSSLVGEN